MTEQQQEEEALREFHAIVCSIITRNDSFAFRDPVDWRGMQLHDYPEIIKQPMDLGTLRVNLESCKYNSLADAARDMRLIWENCKVYNGEGSEFYILAEKLSTIFEESYTALLSLVNSRRDRHRVPMTEERLRVSHDIFKINSIELGRVLAMVEIMCPEALSYKRSTEEVLLNFEVISPRCFHDVNIYTMECLLERKDRRRKTAQDGAENVGGGSASIEARPGRGRKRKKMRSGSELSGGSGNNNSVDSSV